MKQIKLLFTSFLSLLLVFSFTSCDKIGSEGGDDANYWNSNSLVRAQLKGKVKSVTISDQYYSSTTEFNDKGNVTKHVYDYNKSSTSISNYTYDASGKLIKVEASSTYEGRTDNSTQTFEYNNPGKYVATSPVHWAEVGLTPNLSKSTYTRKNITQTTKYVLEGNKMYAIYESPADEYGPARKDTILFTTYDGAYPVKGGGHAVMTASYRTNGMFSTYVESFSGLDEKGNIKEPRTTTFIDNPKYLLKKTQSWSPTDVTTYTYNDKFDVLTESSSQGYIEEYSDYVYDKNDNWTSRKVRTKNGDTWSEAKTESRVIVYY